jgi:3-oxoacyl-[acyl-carrier-protein] synthase III
MKKINVKERAEEMTTFMNEEQTAAVRILANELHRVNTAMMQCVEAGLAVELQRVARHHDGTGYWGDMMIPIVMKQSIKNDA